VVTVWLSSGCDFLSQYGQFIGFPIFRYTTGHHLIDTYTQDDALRFVAWIDLLLSMLKTVARNVNVAVQNTP